MNVSNNHKAEPIIDQVGDQGKVERECYVSVKDNLPKYLWWQDTKNPDLI